MPGHSVSGPLPQPQSAAAQLCQLSEHGEGSRTQRSTHGAPLRCTVVVLQLLWAHLVQHQVQQHQQH